MSLQNKRMSISLGWSRARSASILDLISLVLIFYRPPPFLWFHVHLGRHKPYCLSMGPKKI